MLQESLFWQKDCIVLTSATLTTEGNFEYMKERLGLKGADEFIIDAPFDYATSAMIYLLEDIPEPDKSEYQKMVEQSLVNLCRATQGHTLALFTSHMALRATYAAIQAPLEEEGILVLGQGIDGSPKRLLKAFKTDPRAVLLGTASLREGIDVVGKALSILVIVRLPFSVPTDPVSSARSELLEDPFNQYNLPQTVLKFKQGFGRLIRSKHDKGAMVILDRRLQTKPYGKAFLQSLPKCTVRSGRLRQMPQEIVQWLGLT
jgi:DNA polymerase-3 subunit epsilon/ATP-dependent DNA helicase DinG